MKQHNRYHMSRQSEDHYFATDSEVCPEFDWKTDKLAVLMDIKYLMKEYYMATLINEGQALKVQFNNGQNFVILVNECA